LQDSHVSHRKSTNRKAPILASFGIASCMAVASLCGFFAILYYVKGTIPTAAKWIAGLATAVMLIGYVGTCCAKSRNDLAEGRAVSSRESVVAHKASEGQGANNESESANTRMFWYCLMYGSSLIVWFFVILYSVKGTTMPTPAKWIVVIATVMMLVGYAGTCCAAKPSTENEARGV
jgi:hypothetical protein